MLSEFIFQGILICTWRDYSGNTYGVYDYPNWANFAGWAITFSSVICIPIVAIYKVCQEEGPIFEVRTVLEFCFLNSCIRGLRILLNQALTGDQLHPDISNMMGPENMMQNSKA